MRYLYCLILMLAAVFAQAQSRPAATRPATSQPTTQPGKLPGIQVDLEKKQVRIECVSLGTKAPLELLVCQNDTKEYESVLMTKAKPSHVHMAMLMAGLKPGKPVRYDDVQKKRLAPEGQPIKITCEFIKDGVAKSIPAEQMMIHQKTSKPMGPGEFVFAGSIMDSETGYLGDLSGEIISVVNFAATVVDRNTIQSDKNETLEWVINPDVVPPKDTKVWVVLEAVK